MLLCALLVWVIFPFEYLAIDEISIRKTYLTETDCNKDLNKNNIKNRNCILIDKRVDFSYEEWGNDICFMSENIWEGK